MKPDPKAPFRAQFRTYRAHLSAVAYQQRSQQICAHLADLPEIQRAETIHVYWPLAERGEVDTRPLIEAWHAAGKTVVLPVVTQFSGTPRMEHRRYTGSDGLQKNRWGLHEPIASECVPVAVLDVVIVPALGMDWRGHRMGHGKGFYDAFLAEASAFTIGLVYAACVVECLPTAAHDIPLDAFATESMLQRIGSPM